MGHDFSYLHYSMSDSGPDSSGSETQISSWENFLRVLDRVDCTLFRRLRCGACFEESSILPLDIIFSTYMVLDGSNPFYHLFQILWIVL